MKTNLKHFRPQNDYCAVLDPRDFGTQEQVEEKISAFPLCEGDFTDEQWSLVAYTREQAFVQRRISDLESTLEQLEHGAKRGNRHCAAVLGSAILCLYSRHQVVADGLSWLARAADEGVAGACASLQKWYADRYSKNDLWDYEDLDVGLDSCYVPTRKSPLLPFPENAEQCHDQAWLWGLRGIVAGNPLCEKKIRHFPVDWSTFALDPALLERAAETGNMDARFLHAQSLFHEGASLKERRKATATFRELAETGAVGAALLLAKSIEEDPDSCPGATSEEAVKWYRMAAENGVPAAMRILSGHLSEGRSVPKDETAAADWLRRSAEAGDSIGRLLWGAKTLTRKGASSKEQREGVRWIRLAAEEGNVPEAWAMMALIYTTGVGSYQNRKKAADCLKRARSLGCDLPADFLDGMAPVGKILSSLSRHPSPKAP